MIELTHAEKFMFKDAGTNCYMAHCIDLLESFDLALRIDDER